MKKRRIATRLFGALRGIFSKTTQCSAVRARLHANGRRRSDPLCRLPWLPLLALRRGNGQAPKRTSASSVPSHKDRRSSSAHQTTPTRVLAPPPGLHLQSAPQSTPAHPGTGTSCDASSLHRTWRGPPQLRFSHTVRLLGRVGFGFASPSPVRTQVRCSLFVTTCLLLYYFCFRVASAGSYSSAALGPVTCDVFSDFPAFGPWPRRST